MTSPSGIRAAPCISVFQSRGWSARWGDSDQIALYEIGQVFSTSPFVSMSRMPALLSKKPVMSVRPGKARPCMLRVTPPPGGGSTARNFSGAMPNVCFG